MDALILYFGEDPARCPFEQGMLLMITLWPCSIPELVDGYFITLVNNCCSDFNSA